MKQFFLHISLPLAAVMFACALFPNPGLADLIRLKNGGEIRGKLLSVEKNLPPEVTVTTVAGALITVPREQVEFVTRRSLVYEEYELKSRLIDDSVSAHLELAEWCQANRLPNHRQRHLEHVISLEPDHEAARKGLGYQKLGGIWTTHEEQMLSQGYVRYRGRYITPEEKELLENSRADRELQREWFTKINSWTNQLSSRRPEQRQLAIKNFQEIRAPQAVPALKKFLATAEERETRLFALQILEKIDDPAAAKVLLQIAVMDSDQGLRHQAVEKIPAHLMNVAASELIHYLQHEDNLVVRRAGVAMKGLKDPKLVPYLIEALTTNHRYRVPVEIPAIGITRGPGGIITPGLQPPLLPPELEAAFLAGLIPPENILPPPSSTATQWVTVRVNQQNPEVLEALREITLVDFGYDKRTWKLWLMSLES